MRVSRQAPCKKRLQEALRWQEHCHLGAVSKKLEAFDISRGYVEGIDLFLERDEMAGGNRHVVGAC